MDDEEPLALGADAYLSKLLERKSMLQKFMSAIKVLAIAVSLILSVIALNQSSHRDISKLSKMKLQIQHEIDLYNSEFRIIATLNNSLNALLKNLKKPKPMFDCHRTSRLAPRSGSAVVNYDGCTVDYTDGGMDPGTGVFNVTRSGIYQLSFTAKYVAHNQGRFGAWSDLFVIPKDCGSGPECPRVIADSQREYRGGTDTNGNGGSAGSESSTHTMILMHPLVVGDMVYVKFNKDSNSYMHSDDDKDVHFSVRMVIDGQDGYV